MKIFYETQATAQGGRSGTAALDDGSFEVTMVPPGTDKEGVNPEQLFALGYAACFDNALTLTAKHMKLEPTSARTSAKVGIGQNAQGGYSLDLDLTVEVQGLAKEQAEALIKATDSVCPYSNAVRGNVDVRLHTIISE